MHQTVGQYQRFARHDAIELATQRFPAAVQALVLAQQFVHTVFGVRREAQQRGEKIQFFVFMVQRRGFVEIRQNLMNRG